jgi:hypothetical protein
MVVLQTGQQPAKLLAKDGHRDEVIGDFDGERNVVLKQFPEVLDLFANWLCHCRSP